MWVTEFQQGDRTRRFGLYTRDQAEELASLFAGAISYWIADNQETR